MQDSRGNSQATGVRTQHPHRQRFGFSLKSHRHAPQPLQLCAAAPRASSHCGSNTFLSTKPAIARWRGNEHSREGESHFMFPEARRNPFELRPSYVSAMLNLAGKP